jgi:hypothetical protein
MTPVIIRLAISGRYSRVALVANELDDELPF